MGRWLRVRKMSLFAAARNAAPRNQGKLRTESGHRFGGGLLGWSDNEGSAAKFALARAGEAHESPGGYLSIHATITNLV